MNLPPLPFEARPVRRIARLSREEFVPSAITEPVVVTGCMEDWPLFQGMRARESTEQKLALLGSYIGQQPVIFHDLPKHFKGQFHFDGTPDRLTFGDATRRENVPFDLFSRRMQECLSGASGDAVYMQANFIEKGSPLFGALGPNILPFFPEGHELAMIWVGSNGQVINLHYDDFMTVLCMVNGVKRVTLLPPETLPDLYLAPFDRMLEGCQSSLVRVLEPDFERYPRFKRALEQAIVAVLEPGDVLIMPPMWWHHVESYGLNMMVNSRVFMASFQDLDQAYTNLSQAMRLFVPRTQAQRNQALSLYRETVFGPGAAAASPREQGVEETPEDRQHRLATRDFAARIPVILREHLARHYEHFVFQANGDPHPTLPGVLDALVERNLNAHNMFPRVDEVEP
ncbi:cupin-like domain-containing protein [Archangium gephyra]|uniref:cupin-like domain-containing protein n=1 Tax=Archangium gephyra TaxID=48 RepID=UPI003B796B5B